MFALLLPSGLSAGCTSEKSLSKNHLLELFVQGVVPLHRQNYQSAKQATLMAVKSSAYVDRFRFSIVLRVFRDQLPENLLSDSAKLTDKEAVQLGNVVDALRLTPGLGRAARLACEDVCSTFIALEEGKQALWGRPHATTGSMCHYWETYDQPYA